MRETTFDVHLETEREREILTEKKEKKKGTNGRKRPSGMNFRSLENERKESCEARNVSEGGGCVESSSASEF